MLKDHAAAFRQIAMFSDMTVVAASFALAYNFHDAVSESYSIEVYGKHLAVVLILWGFFLNHFGLYTSFRTRDISEVAAVILKSAFWGFLIFGSLSYLLKFPHMSRGTMSLIFLISGWGLCLERVAALIFLKTIRRKGMNFRNILIVGTGVRAHKFIQSIRRHKDWGLKIIGLIDEDADKEGQIIHGYPVVGRLKDIPDILKNKVVDEVVFVVPRSWIDRIEEAIHYCESQGTKIHLALDIFNLKLSRVKQTELDGIPLLTFESAPDKVWFLLVKRFMDIVVSLILLIGLIPFFAVVVAAIKLTSVGSVFYKQARVGLNGRKFILYKFRTMVVGAEKKLNDLMIYNEMTGPAFKMKNDPRLTKIGLILRQFSIDELPQLWNVLKGDMSLVGPRPPLPDEVMRYQSWHRRKLSMRPGITCMWQTAGRNRITDFEEWLKLDLRYIDNWSLWLDIQLLLKTIPAVFLRVGAH